MKKTQRILALVLGLSLLLVLLIACGDDNDMLSGTWVEDRNHGAKSVSFSRNSFTWTIRETPSSSFDQFLMFYDPPYDDIPPYDVVDLENKVLHQTGTYSISDDKIELVWDYDGKITVRDFSRTENTLTIDGFGRYTLQK